MWPKGPSGEKLDCTVWGTLRREACFSCLFQYIMIFAYAFVNLLSREFAVKRQEHFVYPSDISWVIFY